MTIIPYHVESGGEYYSLADLHDSRTDAQEACSDYADGEAIAAPIGIGDYYGEYTATTVSRGTVKGDYEQSRDSTITVVNAVLNAFREIHMNQDPEWYKPLQPDRLAQAVDRVQWRQSVAEVGGQLVSRLIVAHGLPNANHRTSLTTLEIYLRSHRELDESPDTNTGDEWVPWVNTYIRESKRLLTVRRNHRTFRDLQKIGVTGVRRKNDVVIDFDNYPPDRDNPWDYYRTRHETTWTDFTRTYLQKWGVKDLASETDSGLRVFAARL
jgi:hypothetical protein